MVEAYSTGGESSLEAVELALAVAQLRGVVVGFALQSGARLLERVASVMFGLALGGVGEVAQFVGGDGFGFVAHRS